MQKHAGMLKSDEEGAKEERNLPVSRRELRSDCPHRGIVSKRLLESTAPHGIGGNVGPLGLQHAHFRVPKARIQAQSCNYFTPVRTV